jgi:hypothetical protein
MHKGGLKGKKGLFATAPDRKKLAKRGRKKAPQLRKHVLFLHYKSKPCPGIGGLSTTRYSGPR